MTVSASYVDRTAFLLQPILGVVLAAVCLAGCAATTNSADHGDQLSGAATTHKDTCSPALMMAAQEAEKGIYVIRPGDELQLDFYLNPEFNRSVTVRQDGDISLDLVGSMPAAGLTPEQLADNLNKAYLHELRNPGAVVHIKDSPSWRVYVQGQVAHAGVFPLQPGETAMQAIAQAGGVTEDAGAGDAVLIRRDACGNPEGQKIDLRAADSGTKLQDMALMPSDILVIPRSPIANVDLFVKHYVKNLLPVDTYMPLPL
jgi:polysaccharide biosynthesis/export protein